MIVANCSAVKSMVIDYGDLRQRMKAEREKKIDDYDWAEDAIASYAVVIKALRERYLEERLPSESAKEWLERTGQ